MGEFVVMEKPVVPKWYEMFGLVYIMEEGVGIRNLRLAFIFVLYSSAVTLTIWTILMEAIVLQD